MATRLEFGEEEGEEGELTAGFGEVLVHENGVVDALFNVLVVEEGVADAFAQLHQEVVEFGALGNFGFTPVENGFDEPGVFGEDGLVEFALEGGHGDGDNDLCHGREVGEHLCLCPAEEEWPDEVVQYRHVLVGQLSKLLLHLLCVHILGVQELQQIEQFARIVLERCSGEEDLVTDLELLEVLVKQRLVILETLAFVDN